MKRFAILLLVLVAARPTPIQFDEYSVQHQNVVEQQSPGGALCQVDCVVNLTGCPWDADESVSVQGDGYLDPGGSVVWESCVIADWTTHLVWLAGGARRGDLAFSIAAVNSHTAVTAAVSGSYGQLCLLTPEYDRPSGVLSEVSGSNGGVGEPTVITVTVTNTGSHRVRDMLVRAGIQFAGFTNVRAFYCGDSLTCVGSTTPGLEPRTCWGAAYGDMG